jgi:hypothetical protein
MNPEIRRYTFALVTLCRLFKKKKVRDEGNTIEFHGFR